VRFRFDVATERFYSRARGLALSVMMDARQPAAIRRFDRASNFIDSPPSNVELAEISEWKRDVCADTT